MNHETKNRPEKVAARQGVAASKNELLHLIRTFHNRGWSPATSTNYSFRNPGGNTFTISRSGVDKSKFGISDFMIVDEDGLPAPGYEHLKPSAETRIHTTLYKDRSVNVILHTHSLASTLLSLRYSAAGAVTLTGFELLKALTNITTHEAAVVIPVFENSQDMIALSAKIDGICGPGFLLAGHGLYAWGSDIAEAKRHVEALEFLFECVNMLHHVNTSVLL